MNHPDSIERVFPLSQGTPERALLRPPRIFSSPPFAAPAVMGHGAFMRAWAGRRQALIAAAQKTAEIAPVGASLR
ncbi:MAG: hypothetical protein Q8N18_10430 [Opitutaceae bacterium]|nr:hypothetical protein [Opitutaceae bacterium]